MVTDAASALFASPNAAGLTTAPAKGVAAGFEALLASLFGLPTSDAAAAPQSKSPLAPAQDDEAGDAALAALQTVVALPGQVLTATTTPQQSANDDAPARPSAGTWATGDGKPTAGQILAANVAAPPSVPAQAKLDEALASASVPADPTAPDSPRATSVSLRSDAGQHPAPAKTPAMPDLPTLPEQAKAAEAVANAPARAAAGADVVATVVASTIEPPTVKAVAVVADTPAADVAAVEAAPAGAAKPLTPKAENKSEARPGAARAASLEKTDTKAVEGASRAAERAAVLAARAGEDDALEAQSRPIAREADAGAPEHAETGAATSAQAQAAQAPQAGAPVGAPITPRATGETVSRLATQLVSHSAAKSTQFDIALEPAGLGKVDIRVQIAPDGGLTAALAFATPHAASELRARAGELQAALQQAGFDVADGALSFDVAGQGGRGESQGQADLMDAWQARTLRAFAALDETPAASLAALPFRHAGSAGLDIRI
jgi:flagellar hook-length control protein FliK